MARGANKAKDWEDKKQIKQTITRTFFINISSCLANFNKIGLSIQAHNVKLFFGGTKDEKIVGKS